MSIVKNHESQSVSESQVNHLMNLPDHVLEQGHNTTPSLNESLPLDVRHNGRRQLTWVCLVKGQDRMSRVPNPIGGVDYVFPCLLVVSILLH